jgi:hypothetical protein
MKWPQPQGMFMGPGYLSSRAIWADLSGTIGGQCYPRRFDWENPMR